MQLIIVKTRYCILIIMMKLKGVHLVGFHSIYKHRQFKDEKGIYYSREEPKITPIKVESTWTWIWIWRMWDGWDIIKWAMLSSKDNMRQFCRVGWKWKIIDFMEDEVDWINNGIGKTESALVEKNDNDIDDSVEASFSPNP